MGTSQGKHLFSSVFIHGFAEAYEGFDPWACAYLAASSWFEIQELAVNLMHVATRGVGPTQLGTPQALTCERVALNSALVSKF